MSLCQGSIVENWFALVKNFTEQQLQNATEAVRSRLTYQQAADLYGTAKTIIWKKIRNKHLGKPSAPKALPPPDERYCLSVLCSLQSGYVGINGAQETQRNKVEPYNIRLVGIVLFPGFVY